MASFDKEGLQSSPPAFPFKLRFEPTGDIEFASTVEEGYTNFIDDLMSIPAGSVLYNVFALDKPEEMGGVESKIA